MNTVKVIKKNPGSKVAWEQDGYRLYFGDEEIMVNASKYQRDWPVHLDICSNRDGQMIVGTGDGLYYVAQIDIPATKYTEPEMPETDGETDGMTAGKPPKPIALNMGDVTLTLWATENLPQYEENMEVQE